MNHIQKFDEYNNINEEISFLSPKKRLKNLFTKFFKNSNKELKDFRPSIDLTSTKELFSQVCEIIGSEDRIKGVQDIIKNCDVYTIDSILIGLKRLKKDLDDDRQFIGSFTYDPKEKKFYYVSYYN